MNVEARFAELETLAAAYAAAQAELDHLQEFRKSKKAILMKDAEMGGVTSAVMQERDAYRNVEYLDLLDGLQEATENALKLKWQLTIAQMKFEYWRTTQANKRAEMNLR